MKFMVVIAFLFYGCGAEEKTEEAKADTKLVGFWKFRQLLLIQPGKDQLEATYTGESYINIDAEGKYKDYLKNFSMEAIGVKSCFAYVKKAIFTEGSSIRYGETETDEKSKGCGETPEESETNKPLSETWYVNGNLLTFTTEFKESTVKITYELDATAEINEEIALKSVENAD